jgi:hypothetical protein
MRKIDSGRVLIFSEELPMTPKRMASRISPKQAEVKLDTRTRTPLKTMTQSDTNSEQNPFRQTAVKTPLSKVLYFTPCALIIQAFLCIFITLNMGRLAGCNEMVWFSDNYFGYPKRQ